MVGRVLLQVVVLPSPDLIRNLHHRDAGGVNQEEDDDVDPVIVVGHAIAADAVVNNQEFIVQVRERVTL